MLGSNCPQLRSGASLILEFSDLARVERDLCRSVSISGYKIRNYTDTGDEL